MKYYSAVRSGQSLFPFFARALLDALEFQKIKDELALTKNEVSYVKEFISYGFLIGLNKERDSNNAYILAYKHHPEILIPLKLELLKMIQEQWRIDSNFSQQIDIYILGLNNY